MTSESFPLPKKYLDSFSSLLSVDNELNLVRETGLSLAIGIERLPIISPSVVPNHLKKTAASYLGNIDEWGEIFSLFKYNILYSTLPLYGLLNAKQPYASYEQGTLRLIANNNNLTYDLAGMAYAESAAIFVTNADYILSEKKLELDNKKIIYIPHGFDLNSFDRFLVKHRVERDKQMVRFIAPARHTWATGEEGNCKGNDLIVRAALAVKLNTNCKFIITFVNYGQDVAATKQLIHDLGVEECFEWIGSQTKEQLWAIYLNSHAVLDQFVIPAIGAIGVESLALGVRLINADNGSLKIFFDEQPPLLTANTVDEISKQLQFVIADPDDSAQLGLAAKEWFRRRHHELQLLKGLKRGLRLIDAAYEKQDSKYIEKFRYSRIRHAIKHTKNWYCWCSFSFQKLSQFLGLLPKLFFIKNR